MVPLSASWPQVHAFRLRRHHLDRPAGRNQLVDVVRDTCGIQAQLPSAAGLSLRARIRGLRQEEIARALENERTLVRAWTMRGALHLIPSEDFLLYVRALGPRAGRSLRWMARRGLADREADTIVDAIVRALGNGPLTRKALGERVAASLGERARPWVQHGWGGLVQIACLRGLVCFGPGEGNEVAFVSRDTWLPTVQDYGTSVAGETLLRRFLNSFGPATPQDFAKWADMSMSAVRSVWEVIERDLVEVHSDGRRAWLARGDVRRLLANVRRRPSVRLLPSFDSYLLAHADKSHLVDRFHYKRVYRKAGWLSPVVLIDGRVAGVWSYGRSGSRLSIRVEPFREMSRTIREQVEAEAQDVGRFLGLTAEASFVS